MPLLDDAGRYRALLARDVRFDGVFFVGVTSTRIYCRPVCRAPSPRADRCRWFTSAAAAERRGFRPCLRCRPELAPGDRADATAASVDAVARLARVAASRIADGALDRDGLDALAGSLGVSARHLRRAVERELGATPVELAQTRRLLTAKQLLTETTLPIASVALASGFSSLRRFNALFQARYRLAPTALRRRVVHGSVATGDDARDADARDDAATTQAITLALAYRPPYDWPAMLGWLAARVVPGVELVVGDRYLRTIALHGHTGWIAIGAGATGRRASSLHAHALRVDVSSSLLPVLVPLLARLRRLLDLDADPHAIAAHIGRDARLAPLVTRRPGLRIPGAIDGFELALRAILGQQVTVQGATTLSGRLATLLGEPLHGDTLAGAPAALSRLTPTAARVAEAGVDAIAGIGLPRARAACIVSLARAVVDGTLPELAGDATPGDPVAFVRRFLALPGIGPWTAEYVAMRALRWPDAFPDGDLGLRNAMHGLTPAALRRAAEPWRPWRAYAALQLWASLADTALSKTPNVTKASSVTKAKSTKKAVKPTRRSTSTRTLPRR